MGRVFVAFIERRRCASFDFLRRGLRSQCVSGSEATKWRVDKISRRATMCPRLTGEQMLLNFRRYHNAAAAVCRYFSSSVASAAQVESEHHII
jgi:hypothetical protein